MRSTEVDLRLFSVFHFLYKNIASDGSGWRLSVVDDSKCATNRTISLYLVDSELYEQPWPLIPANIVKLALQQKPLHHSDHNQCSSKYSQQPIGKRRDRH